ncbi:bestrophin-like domain [Amycolatopsis samaneae]|uniref:DUF4239 domain-containing protein n=1 Tax=Amycolatopsis samaneae TaxID=664691 RepID=A0ABW5G7D2_9PSEU
MNMYVTGILWVAGAAVVGGVIGYLVRRFGWDEGRRDNNDAAGQVFTIVGGLQAVVAAFVLISLFDGVNVAREESYKEANGVVAAAWAAESLPGEVKDKLHQLARAYLTTVEKQEWPRLADGGKVPDTGWSQLDQMRQTVAEVQVDGQDGWLVDRKQQASSQLWEVFQTRQSRLEDIGHHSVGDVVWFALILGGLLALLLPNLFGGTRLVAHVLIVSTVAGTVALVLFTIYQLQNPFSGGAKVSSEAFTAALERLS